MPWTRGCGEEGTELSQIQCPLSTGAGAAAAVGKDGRAAMGPRSSSQQGTWESKPGLGGPGQPRSEDATAVSSAPSWAHANPEWSLF